MRMSKSGDFGWIAKGGVDIRIYGCDGLQIHCLLSCEIIIAIEEKASLLLHLHLWMQILHSDLVRSLLWLTIIRH